MAGNCLCDCVITTYGFVFNAVQANAITGATSHAWGWNEANLMLPLGGFDLEVSWIGLVLVLITAMIILAGSNGLQKLLKGWFLSWQFFTSV